jgi:hypothetical protein
MDRNIRLLAEAAQPLGRLAGRLPGVGRGEALPWLLGGAGEAAGVHPHSRHPHAVPAERTAAGCARVLAPGAV